MKSLNEQLKDLMDEERNKKKEDESYTMKTFEILEGEIREVADDEGPRFFENPASFPESIQRKYTGTTLKEWKPVANFSGPIPEGFEEYQACFVNPFTGEKYFRSSIRQKVEVPPTE